MKGTATSIGTKSRRFRPVAGASSPVGTLQSSHRFAVPIETLAQAQGVGRLALLTADRPAFSEGRVPAESDTDRMVLLWSLTL